MTVSRTAHQGSMPVVPPPPGRRLHLCHRWSYHLCHYCSAPPWGSGVHGAGWTLRKSEKITNVMALPCHIHFHLQDLPDSGLIFNVYAVVKEDILKLGSGSGEGHRNAQFVQIRKEFPIFLPNCCHFIQLIIRLDVAMQKLATKVAIHLNCLKGLHW